jgi:hypothetical protein
VLNPEKSVPVIPEKSIPVKDKKNYVLFFKL